MNGIVEEIYTNIIKMRKIKDETNCPNEQVALLSVIAPNFTPIVEN